MEERMAIPAHVYGLNEASDAVVEKARRIAREVAAAAADDVDRSGRFPDEAIRALAVEGFGGLLLPRAAGGLGEGARTFCGVVEALAEGCGSTAMVFVMHSLAAHAIAASPIVGRKEDLLREMASGKALATLAYSEETSRSNFWVQGSELVPARDGDGYELDARKTWVTSAGHATIYVGAARRPGATTGTDFTVFVTQAGDRSPTFEVVGRYDGLGLRGNASCRITLARHRIAAADLLTEHGRGREFSGKVLVPWFDLGSAAMSNGLCRAAVRR
jgi:alkylation response protein AidB-like acyl-CoA dehydrogenase